MLTLRYAREIFERVVKLVSIFMMDNHAYRNWTVVMLPYQTVQKLLSAVMIPLFDSRLLTIKKVHIKHLFVEKYKDIILSDYRQYNSLVEVYP